MDIGNLSEVTGALTAVAALIAAIYAARQANKQLKAMNAQLELERVKDNRAVEVLEQSQASLISAWLTSRDWFSYVTVKNSSPASIFKVSIEVSFRTNDYKEAVESSLLNIEVVPPGEYIFVRIPSNPNCSDEYPNPTNGFKLTKPSPHQKESGWSHAFPATGIRTSPVLNSPNWRVVKLSFTDSHGVCWVRDDSGLMKSK
ncbi:hypothetical protein ACN082_03255 [Rothia sp. CCM 9417]|uniref:hypothetical protein n=1 Tax=Rothia sp. CCM 9417 TaxID=3402657 RepID=UPI003AE7ADAF